MRTIRFLSLAAMFVALTLFLAPAAVCGSNFDLAKLTAQAKKVVPEGFETVTENSDDMSAFVSYKKGERGYQFTLSTDMDPQIPNAEAFSHQGKKAWFFTPGLDSSGSIMVILKPNELSLTLVYSAGFSSDAEVTRRDMVGLLDKMDLNALE